MCEVWVNNRYNEYELSISRLLCIHKDNLRDIEKSHHITIE